MQQKEPRMPGIRLYCPELALMEEVLTAKEYIGVMHALRVYVTDGTETTSLKGGAQACYLFLRDRVEADMRAYRETCERNRANIEKRWAKEKAGEDAEE